MKHTLISLVGGAAIGATAMTLMPANVTELVQASQESHYAKTGTYYQVHTYQTPSGERGFQITYTDADGTHIKGYGPEASARTAEYPAFKSSTSTNETPSR